MNIKEIIGFMLPDSFISDAYKNLFKKEEMKLYAKEVKALLDEAYKDIGGALGIDTEEDLINEGNFWKLVTRNGKVTAACIYTMNSLGRKAKYGMSDGTPSGKKDLISILTEDVTQVARGAYYEVSGAPERILTRLGMKVIPADKVSAILNKTVTPSEDGFHYTRNIAGRPVEKLLLGNI